MRSSILQFSDSVSLLSMPKIELSPVPARELTLIEIIRHGFPGRQMDKEMRQWKARNLPNLFRGMWRATLARKLGIAHFYGQLCLAIITPDGQRRDYGLVSLRVITTTGAGYVVDAFQNLQTLSNMRYHAFGTGSTVEAISDTGLTEIASAYNPAYTRATGTLAEGDTSVIFRSVANTTVTDTVTIGEFGLFSQAATRTGTPTGGYMLDRLLVSSETVFAAFLIQSDFRLTLATGT